MVTHIKVQSTDEPQAIEIRRICTHPNAYVEKACCSSPDSDTGLFSCGCGGQDSVICPDCDQTLTEDEIQAVLEGNR